MSRWCDQSIDDEKNPHFPVALDEAAILFGTLVAETILASVHVRAPKQAGHMDASDLIKALQNTLQGGAVHIWKIGVDNRRGCRWRIVRTYPQNRRKLVVTCNLWRES